MKNKNWLEIEEEFIKEFACKCTRKCGEFDPDRNNPLDVLAFFKPYFQEKIHTEAVEELENVNNSLTNKNNLV